MSLIGLHVTHSTIHHHVVGISSGEILVAILVKVPGPISQNWDFYSNDASPPNKCWFQISVDTRRYLYFAIAYTLLCKSGNHN